MKRKNKENIYRLINKINILEMIVLTELIMNFCEFAWTYKH